MLSSRVPNMNKEDHHKHNNAAKQQRTNGPRSASPKTKRQHRPRAGLHAARLCEAVKDMQADINGAEDARVQLQSDEKQNNEVPELAPEAEVPHYVNPLAPDENTYKSDIRYVQGDGPISIFGCVAVGFVPGFLLFALCFAGLVMFRDLVAFWAGGSGYPSKLIAHDTVQTYMQGFVQFSLGLPCLLGSIAWCGFQYHYAIRLYRSGKLVAILVANMSLRKIRGADHVERLDYANNSIHGAPYLPIARHVYSRIVVAAYYYVAAVNSFHTGKTSVITHILVNRSRDKTVKSKFDMRLTNQQANKLMEEQVYTNVWTELNLRNCMVRNILSCDQMEEQTVLKIAPLSASDRAKQSFSISRNITNIHITSRHFKEMARGSAALAVCTCQNMDVSEDSMSLTHELRCTWAEMGMIASAFFGSPFLFLLIRALPAALVYSYTLSPWDTFHTIILAPIYEEAIKATVSRLFGVPMLAVGLGFGLLEWVWRGFPESGYFTIWVHIYLAIFPTWFATFCHLTNNFGVVALKQPGAITNMFKTLFHLKGNTLFERAASATNDFEPDPVIDVIISKLGEWNTDAHFNQEEVEMKMSFLKYYMWDNSTEVEQFMSHLGTASIGLVPALIVCSIAACGISLALTAFTKKALQDLPPARYASGYREGEVPLPPVGKHDAAIKKFPNFYHPVPRVDVMSTLAFTIRGITPAVPDFNHGPSALKGCLRRFCRKVPKFNPVKLRRLKQFVKEYVRTHYIPIPADADVSVPTWLKNNHNYTDARKRELQALYDELDYLRDTDFDISGFIKREAYLSYKPPRGINSRSDAYKMDCGPFFKHMEEQVYAQPCYHDGVLDAGDAMSGYGPFIKHIPTHLRPAFIVNMLGAYPGPVYETDYSQFEKHFIPEVMSSVEMVLYKHMLKNFPDQYDRIKRTMCGENRCNYKSFRITIEGRRMSGEMCTSLGNGFSNLMLMKFAAHLKGGFAEGVIEGDDALFYSSVPLTPEDFADLGFDIKILKHDDLLKSSFCGLVMSSDFSLLKDPRKILCKFGWSLSPYRKCSLKVRMGLLRGKALSLAYENPRCPVVAALAKRVLVFTQGQVARFGTGYQEDQIRLWQAQFSDVTSQALIAGPTLTTRTEFAELFNFPVSLQYRIEDIISRWDGSPCDDPLMQFLFASGYDDLKDFDHHYVRDSVSLMDSCGR